MATGWLSFATKQLSLGGPKFSCRQRRPSMAWSATPRQCSKSLLGLGQELRRRERTFQISFIVLICNRRCIPTLWRCTLPALGATVPQDFISQALVALVRSSGNRDSHPADTNECSGGLHTCAQGDWCQNLYGSFKCWPKEFYDTAQWPPKQTAKYVYRGNNEIPLPPPRRMAVK
mmetsp:Transcript_29655/g.69731  ORF Transcript_29655/g.69731 Transcript_29655/m.69731 type:complete len:175 (+) Transcript_29655:1241-1765(+)